MRPIMWLLPVSLLACVSDEAPANQVSGVRILAISVDQPFAKPGESVALNVLAVDGRKNRTMPMQTFFWPAPCVNPDRDDVTKCFTALAKDYPLRTNLNERLTSAATATIALPVDIIASHPPPRGGLRYGIAFGFVMACAGHVERVETAGFVGAPPFGCFNEQGTLLGKDEYVFAHARILAYADLRNSNPVIDAITLDGKPLDGNGFTLPLCTESDERDCPKANVDAQIAPGAQEPDFTSGPPGSGFREQIWVSYFATAGKMNADLSVIYDAQDGKLPATDNGLFSREGTGMHTLYAVAHDNRGGVSWRQFPFTLK
jgi:hypothetical protein